MRCCQGHQVHRRKGAATRHALPSPASDRSLPSSIIKCENMYMDFGVKFAIVFSFFYILTGDLISYVCVNIAVDAHYTDTNINRPAVNFCVPVPLPTGAYCGGAAKNLSNCFLVG